MNKKQINAALENAINKAAEAAKTSLAQAKKALTEKNVERISRAQSKIEIVEHRVDCVMIFFAGIKVYAVFGIDINRKRRIFTHLEFYVYDLYSHRFGNFYKLLL